jgi:preprotein translocase subunit SecA
MDYLREGIHLRGMAQKDPLVEYRNEGHLMFAELGAAIRDEVVQILFHAQLEPAAAEEALAVGDGNGAQPGANLQYEHQSLAGADAIAAAGAGTASTATMAMSGGGAVATGPRQIVKSERENIGRNDPCWCGSGKKFKKCHGA